MLTMNKMTLFGVILVCISMNVYAADHEVIQKNLDFSPKKLEIKVGDTVTFKNEDSTIHNVYSLSEANTFDLGGSPKGKAKTVTFDKPGVIDVECAVHLNMKMAIEVKK
jgi:plastocyanin